MSNDLDKEYVRESVEAKSDQRNADDLIPGPITVTITGVKRGKTKEQPIAVELDGDKEKPWLPCKGMRRILIAAYGDDPYEWVGKRLTLFRNPDVMYGNLKVGGIEISHMSHIATDMQFMRTVRRGVKAAFNVKRLAEPKAVEPTEAERKYIEDAQGQIQQAETMESLKAIGFILKNKSDAVRNSLRPAYDKRKKELETKEPTNATS